MVYGEQYDCIYKAKGKGGDTLDNLNSNFEIALDHYACFARVYEKLRCYNYSEVTYSIYLFKEDLPGKNFNLCNKIETKKILRCLQKTVPFTYRFGDGRYKLATFKPEEIDYTILEVTIRGNYAQHLWLTSMLRCFFEWPFNIAAKEACILQSEIKEVDGFDLTKENWINLYLTIAAQLGSYDLHGVVGFSGLHPKAKTYQEWKQKLESITGNGRVYPKICERGGRFGRTSERVGIYSEDDYNKGTQSRAAKYVAAYKDKLSWKN